MNRYNVEGRRFDSYRDAAAYAGIVATREARSVSIRTRGQDGHDSAQWIREPDSLSPLAHGYVLQD